MNQEEFYDIVGLLHDAGLNPMVCNKWLHLSTCRVRCGVPAEPGQDTMGEGIMLPRELVGSQPEICITAEGDSMIGAGFSEGDLLRVRLHAPVHDGDVVVAMVDGAATAKVLFSDEQGRRWLVPRNSNYQALLLTPDKEVRILGIVVGVEKRVVRASSAECLQAIRHTLERMRQPEPMTDEKIDAVITAMAPEVSNGRQWYAVYRPLVDCGAICEGCFRDFCQRVWRVVPAHAHLPVGKELGRLAVQSFRKRVALWDVRDAPVNGARFADYLRIARLTAQRIAA